MKCGRKGMTSDCKKETFSASWYRPYYEEEEWYCPDCGGIITHMSWDE